MPLVLLGEGHYVLSSIKQITVTEEFVGLGEKVTRCQTEEYRVDCLSRRFRDSLLASCKCSPWNLRSHLGSSLQVCSPAGLDCVRGLGVPGGDCLEKCEGTVMDAVRFNSEREEEGRELLRRE